MWKRLYTLLFSKASAEWCSLAPKQLWHFSLLKMFGSNFLHFRAITLCLHYFAVCISDLIFCYPFWKLVGIFQVNEYCLPFNKNMITKRTELHFYRNVGFQQVLKKQVWSITVNTRSNPGIYRKCWAAQNTNMKLIFFFRARSQFSRWWLLVNLFQFLQMELEVLLDAGIPHWCINGIT
jgi:hypothetical protein